MPQRLAKAKSIGAIPIDFTSGDPVAQILKLEPEGVDRSCDCVGYEAVNAEGVNVGNIVITNAINVTRAGGGIGVIGVYSTTDPGKSLYKTKFVNEADVIYRCGECPGEERGIRDSVRPGLVQVAKHQRRHCSSAPISTHPQEVD